MATVLSTYNATLRMLRESRLSSTSDDIPAMLSRNEYVLDAADVRAIGGGSNKKGALILDRERKKLDRGGGALSRLGRAA